ncbi:MAG: hypothetical protein AB4426_32625 [Xenococcaceae cyanobacterium]
MIHINAWGWLRSDLLALLSYTSSNNPRKFTSPMVDPATSLPIQSALIDDTQALAKELNISWKQLITLALQDFIRRCRGRKHLVEKLNAAYADEPDDEETLLLQRMRSSHRHIIEGKW